MQNLKLLRIGEVCQRVGYSRVWLYRLERNGHFPARVQIGPNRVGWLASEVDAWIAAKAAERDTKERELEDIRTGRYRWRAPTVAQGE